METQVKKYQFLDGFWLKIVGIILMSIDHIGLFLRQVSNCEYASYVLRCIGRLALPIFILLLVEGIRYSKNIRNYLLRLSGIMALLMLSQIIIYYGFNDSSIAGGIGNAGSPFIDLVLVGLTLYLIQRKDKYSYISIIPIAYILLTFSVQLYEIVNNYTVFWLPFYLRPEYSILSLMMGIMFYFSKPLAAKMMKKKFNLNDEDINNINEDYPNLSNYLQSMSNVFVILSLFILNVIIYGLSYIPVLDFLSIETWSLLAGLLFIFYNGKRGYNAKWFKYGAYVYFPLHIVIIAVVFYIILIA